MGDSDSDSDSNDGHPPLATLLNSQPSQSRLSASTAAPPPTASSSAADHPPLATAPGRLTRVRKQTRKKEFQDNREAAAMKLNA